MNHAQRRAAARQRARYVLACGRCGQEFDDAENPTLTIGDVERQHFMRMHDTAKITFNLVDRRDRHVVRKLS